MTRRFRCGPISIRRFYVGRLSGTQGTVWQYTAIDVASAYAWAELQTSERNPRSQHCQRLLHRVAAELKAAGWKLQEVTTDNGSEFRSKDFGQTVSQLGARQRFIKAGRPNSNGSPGTEPSPPRCRDAHPSPRTARPPHPSRPSFRDDHQFTSPGGALP
ncbi:MAG: transposase family protein [Solirubrobacterales bacterium]|nr:transposase family protein [Solirubrobacterales bacterium]